MMQPNLSPEIQLLAERQAAHCRVMGNPQRILILWLLAERERTVTEIAQAIGASLQSTSHHLRILDFSKMVKARREQHNIFYHLIDNEIVKHCPVLTNSPKVKLTEVPLV
ncbi:MAG: winged helix-turn-helix transcriptional regulator [Anaerolineales bacterium]|nr:winged helix-turn-helix transcriptional regulator [Anaerolineales bacterium]